MSIYSYTRCPLYINNEFILATEAQFSNNNNIEPQFVWGDNALQETLAREDYQTSLVFSYFPNHNDVVYSAINSNTLINVNFGGIALESGYVSSLSVQGKGGESVSCQAEIQFYNRITGNFIPSTISRSRRYIDKIDLTKLTDLPSPDTVELTQSLVTIPISFNYRYESDIYPQYRVNDTTPNEIRVGKRQISFSLDGENLSQFVSLNGDEAVIKLALRNLCDEDFFKKEYKDSVQYFYDSPLEYMCSGKIVNFNIQAQGKNFLQGNIGIIQYL